MIDLIVRVFQTHYPSSSGKLLSLAIARRCGNERGLCWASQQTLSDDTGLSRSTIGRALTELEASGLLVRYRRGSTKNGARLTDILALQFPASTHAALKQDFDPAKVDDGQLDLLDMMGTAIPEDGPDPCIDLDNGSAEPGVTVKPAHASSCDMPMQHGEAQRDQIKNPEEEKDAGERVKPEAAPWPIDEDGTCKFDIAAEALLWHSTDTSAQRSSAEEVVQALRALWKSTKSRDEQPGDWYRRIEMAVRLYMASPSATNEGGRYSVGTHRLLGQEKFISHWCERARKEIGSLGKAARHGTVTAPTADGQVAWMKSFIKHGFWPDAQGPRPDEPGCRLSEDILRSFGFGPHSIRKVARRRLLRFWKSGEWSGTWGPAPTSDACWIPRDLALELHAELVEEGAIDPAAAAEEPAPADAPELESGEPEDPVSSEGTSQTESDGPAYDPADDAAAFD